MSLSEQIYRDSIRSSEEGGVKILAEHKIPGNGCVSSGRRAKEFDPATIDRLAFEADCAGAARPRGPVAQTLSVHASRIPAAPRVSNWSVLKTLSDYLELTKPKIAVLELATVTAAAAVAGLELLPLIHVLIGTALVAASASAANQWIERDRDRSMARTASRPLAARRLSDRSVMWFVVSSLLIGVSYLAATLPWLTALLGLISWALYVLVYTPLKTRTPANTMVGAVAGAIPALMGYTAMGGSLDMRAMSLFMVLFLWQFPHFMAIAWLYRFEYQRAGMRMLTVVDPSGARAGAQALLAALALLPVSLAPIVQPQMGHVVVYFLWAMLLGAGYLLASVVFLIRRNDTTARWLLRASLVYLPGLLGLLLLSAST